MLGCFAVFQALQLSKSQSLLALGIVSEGHPFENGVRFSNGHRTVGSIGIASY